MRIRTRSFVIFLGQGLSQASNILLGIVLARLISKADFGTYRQVYLVYSLIGGLVSFQLASSLYYFMPKVGAASRRKLLSQVFTIASGAALLAGILMFLGAGRIAALFHNPELAPLIRVFSLYPLAEQISQLVPAFMITAERTVRAGVYIAITALGRAGVVIAAFVAGATLSLVIMACVAVAGSIALVGMLDMVRLSRAGIWRPDRELLGEVFGYCWPLWLTAAIGVVNLQLGKLLVSSYFSPELYAVFACGAIELPIVALLTVSVGQAMAPDLVRLVDQGRSQGALVLWQEAARKCSLVIFPVFVYFLVIAQDFIVLLYGPAYSMAVWPFVVYLFMLPIRIAVYSMMLRALGRTPSVAVAAGVAMVVNVAVGAGLMWAGKGSLLSFVGPALGTVAATLVMALILAAQICRAVPVGVGRLLPWRDLGRVMLVSILAGLAAAAATLTAGTPVLRVTVQTLMFAAVLMLFFSWIPLLKKDEVELLYAPWRLVSRRIGHRV